MRKTMMILLSMIMCFALVSSGTQLEAANSPQIKRNVQPIKVDASKLRLRLRTDLRVDVIHSSRCYPCQMPGIDAFYVKDLMVDVSNHKVGTAGAATASVLEVSYFDLMKGKMVTITRHLPKMNPYPKNVWTLQKYKVLNRPILVKRSVGIKAVIKPKATNINDPVPANNKKVIKKCNVMVY